MKLRRTSFLLSGSLLAAILLTSLGYSEPVLYQEEQLQSVVEEPTDEPLQPSPEVIAAWKKAGAEFSQARYRGSEPLPAFHFRLTPTGKLNVLPPPEVPFSLRLSSVTDAGLKELASLTQLQTLDLDNTKVTDAGLKELAGLKQLRELHLSGTKVTDAGVQELQRALPKVRIYH